jgi:ABC-type Mn/Zn transport systems, ATPase component
MLSQKNKIIILKDVTVKYEQRVILPDVNLDIHEGDFVAITGPNGGGKTTLLRVILGLLKPVKGQVEFYKNGLRVNALKVGYLPQKNMIDSRFPITVKEVIESGLLHGKTLFSRKVTETEMMSIDEVLKLIGMEDYRNESIGNLSGGQLQRTLFGRAIISNPDVLVLDEPLSYLDKTFETRLYEIISDLSKTKTIILVSHEMTQISQMATRHVIVDHSIHDCHAEHHYIRTDCE